MPKKYPHLLSPFKVGNHVFKNRMIATMSVPNLVQGPESYPNDGIITHFANKARSGASMVVVGDIDPFPYKPPEDLLKTRQENPNIFNPEHGWLFGGTRVYLFDIFNGGCQNYISQMVEAIHFYDAKCIMMMKVEPPLGYDVSLGNTPDDTEYGSGGAKIWGKEITQEMMAKLIEDATFKAVLTKEVGCDGLYIHMGYRAPLTARLLSPLTNRRTDKYGGSPKNRARFSLELVDSIKQRCGHDFLIMASMSGWEPEGGFTLDGAVEYARMFAGHIDMLLIRGPTNDVSHPTSFTQERTPFLHAAETIKKNVPRIAIVANGGFQDLNLCEDTIASGKADFIGMARAWISNPEYGLLAYQGRNEDVVPCLRCNGCQLSSYYKPWVSVCTVNPIWGLEHKINDMVSPPTSKKRVAVIGGGVAGMEAALIAYQRGHEVTLYEKSGVLGGLLVLYENISFKWPHKDFRKYLVRQIGKFGVRVLLNTEADAEMIKKEEYDAVIAAVGADPIKPDIPGIDNKNVIFAKDVFGKEATLAKNIVVVGGGGVGVEVGMHLAEKEHQVTVLEKAGMLAKDSPPCHSYSMFRQAWEKLPNFEGVVNAYCNGIDADGVNYIDSDGKKQSIIAGSVVIAAGMKAKIDLALRFHDAGKRMYMVGDCKLVGDIQRAMRSAFSTASSI